MSLSLSLSLTRPLFFPGADMTNVLIFKAESMAEKTCMWGRKEEDQMSRVRVCVCVCVWVWLCTQCKLYHTQDMMRWDERPSRPTSWCNSAWLHSHSSRSLIITLACWQQQYAWPCLGVFSLYRHVCVCARSRISCWISFRPGKH